jgi:hypothetical protein
VYPGSTLGAERLFLEKEHLVGARCPWYIARKVERALIALLLLALAPCASSASPRGEADGCLASFGVSSFLFDELEALGAAPLRSMVPLKMRLHTPYNRDLPLHPFRTIFEMRFERPLREPSEIRHRLCFALRRRLEARCDSVAGWRPGQTPTLGCVFDVESAGRSGLMALLPSEPSAARTALSVVAVEW